MKAKYTYRIVDAREWIADIAIRQLSLAGRGLYVDLLAIADQGTPCGYLSFPDDRIIGLLGITASEYLQGVAELVTSGAFARTEGGVLYHPEHARMAERRAIGAANGKLGGNPSLMTRPRP